MLLINEDVVSDRTVCTSHVVQIRVCPTSEGLVCGGWHLPWEGGALRSQAKLTSNDFQCIPFILFPTFLICCFFFYCDWCCFNFVIQPYGFSLNLFQTSSKSYDSFFCCFVLFIWVFPCCHEIKLFKQCCYTGMAVNWQIIVLSGKYTALLSEMAWQDVFVVDFVQTFSLFWH